MLEFFWQLGKNKSKTFLHQHRTSSTLPKFPLPLSSRYSYEPYNMLTRKRKHSPSEVEEVEQQQPVRKKNKCDSSNSKDDINTTPLSDEKKVISSSSSSSQPSTFLDAQKRALKYLKQTGGNIMLEMMIEGADHPNEQHDFYEEPKTPPYIPISDLVTEVNGDYHASQAGNRIQLSQFEREDISGSVKEDMLSGFLLVDNDGGIAYPFPFNFEADHYNKSKIKELCRVFYDADTDFNPELFIEELVHPHECLGKLTDASYVILDAEKKKDDKKKKKKKKKNIKSHNVEFDLQEGLIKLSNILRSRKGYEFIKDNLILHEYWLTIDEEQRKVYWIECSAGTINCDWDKWDEWIDCHVDDDDWIDDEAENENADWMVDAKPIVLKLMEILQTCINRRF